MLFLESNLGDPGLYPGTQHLHDSVVQMLLSILHGDGLMGGRILSGGSEANITALWAYRNSRQRRQVLAPETAHYSVGTAADLLGMNLSYVRVDDSYAMSVDDLEAKISSEKTAVVVAMAGTTEHGQIDPVDEIQLVCARHGVPLHVDAAFGGLVFPFLSRIGYRKRLPAFDFTLAGVTSITVDPHKMGMATAPSGGLLLRNPTLLEAIAQPTTYLSSESLASILGTRCSAGVASAYAMFRFYGINGYMKLLQGCMQNAERLAAQLKDVGFRLAIEPISPVVCIRLDDEDLAKRTQRELGQRNWLVSRTTQPHGIRVVMMPHLQGAIIPDFVSTLRSIVL
jgi:tyrosine decarboxylase/aspartate 1-decarboxylase